MRCLFNPLHKGLWYPWSLRRQFIPCTNLVVTKFHMEKKICFLKNSGNWVFISSLRSDGRNNKSKLCHNTAFRALHVLLFFFFFKLNIPRSFNFFPHALASETSPSPVAPLWRLFLFAHWFICSSWCSLCLCVSRTLSASLIQCRQRCWQSLSRLKSWRRQPAAGVCCWGPINKSQLRN